MIGFKQSVKVFSAKFSLPTDPRKFSPSKVYRYTVLGINQGMSRNYHEDAVMATSISSSERSKVCQDHMVCLTIHFFTDTAKKLLPAALLMQVFKEKWVWSKKIVSSFRNYMKIIRGSSGNTGIAGNIGGN